MTGVPGASGIRSLRPATLLLGLALISLLAAQAGRVPIAGEAWTIVGAVLLLGLGLPHGALDIVLLRDQAIHGRMGLTGALLLYLACAALTVILWIIAPVLALALFLATAIVHFSEDWRAAGSAFLSHAMAAALLAAPALTHGSAVRSIFAGITGDSSSAILAELLLLAAPVAGLSGLVALAMLWQRGEYDRAIGGGLSLIALFALPPVIGFALFFCLFHSPLHVRLAAERSSGGKSRRWTGAVVVLTIAGFGIGAAIYAVATSGGLPTRLVAASFITLSVLTVPHMLVPRLLMLIRHLPPGAGRRHSPARPYRPGARSAAMPS